MFSDNQRIGVACCVFGALFIALGILTLFDRGFLIIGNILFISGVPLILGVQRTAKFFFKRTKVVGTACFFLGILLILVRWPVFGCLIESFGFLNLFGPFASFVLLFLRNAPVVGPFFKLPIFSTLEKSVKKLSKTTELSLDLV